jgi:hypothetical protein
MALDHAAQRVGRRKGERLSDVCSSTFYPKVSANVECFRVSNELSSTRSGHELACCEAMSVCWVVGRVVGNLVSCIRVFKNTCALAARYEREHSRYCGHSTSSPARKTFGMNYFSTIQIGIFGKRRGEKRKEPLRCCVACRGRAQAGHHSQSNSQTPMVWVSQSSLAGARMRTCTAMSE